MKKTTFFALLSCLFINALYSQNLLVNGDFESGGNGVGFSINGAGYNQIVAPFSGTSFPGNYAFTNNPQPINTTFFIAGGDHTTGTGNMMVVDGNTTGGNQRFWRAGNTGGGVCSLTVGATYNFSYWIKSVSTDVVGPANQAVIAVNFTNANNIILVSGLAVAPLPAAGWQKVTYSFTPTSPCVNIELSNSNVNPVGNDFAVDDFLVTPTAPLSATYSVQNSSCPDLNDAPITVDAS
ncbi:MAG: hypothetical protein K2P85_07405, partial [Flavobacteriaceae bacterium]|nr:hypothetical protein [Flavobacteriaceae bacterium]